MMPAADHPRRPAPHRRVRVRPALPVRGVSVCRWTSAGSSCCPPIRWRRWSFRGRLVAGVRRRRHRRVAGRVAGLPPRHRRRGGDRLGCPACRVPLTRVPLRPLRFPCPATETYAGPGIVVQIGDSPDGWGDHRGPVVLQRRQPADDVDHPGRPVGGRQLGADREAAGVDGRKRPHPIAPHPPAGEVQHLRSRVIRRAGKVSPGSDARSGGEGVQGRVVRPDRGQPVQQ